MALFQLSQKNYIKKAFSKYIDKKTMNNILSNNNTNNLELRKIDFILIKIEENNGSIQLKIKGLFDFIQNYNATILDFTSSLVLIQTTSFIDKELDYEKYRNIRKTLVNDLINKFSKDIAIVHGNRDCLFGKYGNENRMNLGPIIPNFFELLKILSNLEFSKTYESL